MPSYGNNGEIQYNQDMDSNGRKLIVSRNAADAAVTASNANANGKALHVTEGKTEFNGDVLVEGVATFNDELRAAINLVIKSLNGMNVINTAGLAAKIAININEEAGDVIIGKPDSIAFDNADVIVRSPRLKIGNEDAEGYIDAVFSGDVVPVPRNLNIGTQSSTADTVLGRSGQTIETEGVLSAQQNVKLNFHDLILDSTNSASQGTGFSIENMGGGVRRLNVFVEGEKVAYFSNEAGGARFVITS